MAVLPVEHHDLGTGLPEQARCQLESVTNNLYPSRFTGLAHTNMLLNTIGPSIV